MQKFYLKIFHAWLCLFLAGFIFNPDAEAQTTLAAGDIAFTAYDCNSTTADVFSFVLLTPISSGTKISFTDQGYQGNNSWGG